MLTLAVDRRVRFAEPAGRRLSLVARRNRTELACGRKAAETLCLHGCPHDGFREYLGRKRADDAGLRLPGPSSRREREHGVAVSDCV